MTASAIDAQAQGRAQRSASARAYYGQSPKRVTYKMKRKQHRAYYRAPIKPAKGTRSDARSVRRKYTHG